MPFEPQDLRPYWQELPRNHPYRQEMEKWDKPKRQGGYNADGIEPYPKMLYKARKRPDGIVAVLETNDNVCTEKGALLVPGAAEQWSRGNYMTVNSEDEERRYYGQGWRATPKEALALYHKEQDDIAELAARRNYEDRHLSERAKAEVKEYEGDSSEHSPEIPEAKRRGGRPRKDAEQN